MLTSIEIQNFQGHESTVLEFSPGVSVIKGTSHRGKSSIIRALRWALFNQPRGEGFKSHFADPKDDVSVGIAFVNDWILRLKGKENNYLADGLDLKALRTDVPDEIKAITQINEVNFQSQSDGYFLIGDSPGIAGKKLNEIIGLEIIDEVRTKANQKVSKLKSKLEFTTEEIESTEKKLEGYKHVKKAERLVGRIDALEDRKTESESQRQKIYDSLDEIKGNQKAIRYLRGKLEVEKDFYKLNKQVEILSVQRERYSKLLDITNALNTYHVVIEEKQVILDLESPFKKIEIDQEKLIGFMSRRDKIQGIHFAIYTLQNNQEELSAILESQSGQKSDLEAKLNFCPTCGAKKKYWRK